MRRILSGLLALLMVCSLPMTVLAAVTADVSLGDVSIGDTHVKHTTKKENSEETEERNDEHGGSVTVTGSSTEHNVSIDVDTSVDVVFDNVQIDVSSKEEAAVIISGEGDVTVELEGTSELTSSENYAGLQTSTEGGRLTITDEDKDGSLTANGGESGAGIGGGYNGDASDITIQGGSVTANGGKFAAGIGGGHSQYDEEDGVFYGGNSSDITISGGTVIANGGYYGAGIGGGTDGDCSEITISGGSVTASGGAFAAGIGGGADGDCSEITISGGSVTANGGAFAAGIGGGTQGDSSDITIKDGSVTANGGKYGAGIGGGREGSGSNITIEDGTVNANGGEHGAGIGGGKYGDGSDITIEDGTVTANGGEYGAGIGGGYEGDGSDITIEDGTVTASGGNGGAGIGGGCSGNGTNISISDGTVHAESGIGYYGAGAGIGGGEDGNGSDINISGGKVTAIGGYFYEDGNPDSDPLLATGAGIGGGGYGGSSANITISGDAKVTAVGAGNAANTGDGWYYMEDDIKKEDNLTLDLGPNGSYNEPEDEDGDGDSNTGSAGGSSSIPMPQKPSDSTSTIKKPTGSDSGVNTGSTAGASRSGYYKGHIWQGGYIYRTIYKVETDKHMRARWTEEMKDGILTITVEDEPAIVTFWPNGLKYLAEKFGIHTIIVKTENCETEWKVNDLLALESNEFVLTQEGETAKLTADGKEVQIG